MIRVMASSMAFRFHRLRSCSASGTRLPSGRVRVRAWHHHATATAAAREAHLPPLETNAMAEQAVILLDVGHPGEAADLTAQARAIGDRHGSRLLRSWLAAAHGETLAVANDTTGSQRAFDDAGRLLPDDETSHDGPYLTLDSTHPARWRGHALARSGHPDAVAVLTGALAEHDTTFTRAETGMQIDLARAHLAAGEREPACAHRQQAERMATAIGSGVNSGDWPVAGCRQ